jgi:GNAT superfamily N-acetyltransferase
MSPSGDGRRPLAHNARVTYSDAELYTRSGATLVASWGEYARGASGAALRLIRGAAVGVFPNEPERSIYNNALLDCQVDEVDREATLDALVDLYAKAGVDKYAVWVHESDPSTVAHLAARGFGVEESTRVMGMDLKELGPPVAVEMAPPQWVEYVRILQLPSDYLRQVDPAVFHLAIGRLGGESVAAAMAFDHDTDCGIFNVTTLQHARRQGLATALTTMLLHQARSRGCSTASLQSTPTAESVYAAIGFRDLGEYLEHVPSRRAVPS